MPLYRARCVTQGGRYFSGEFDVANVGALRAAVEARGAFLIQQKELKRRIGGHRTKLSLETQAQLFDLLAMQLGAGVPVDLAVAKLRDDFPDRRARRILRGVHTELSRSTASLSDALGKYPRSFPDGIVATLKVGEESGGAALASRCDDLRDQIVFRIAIRKTATKAVAYPLFIVSFAACVVGFVLLRLIPNLKPLLDSLNVPLPEITRIILGLSAFLQSSWRLILAGAICGAVTFRLLRAVPPLAVLTDRLMLRLPFVGGIVQALATAEVAKNYRALYGAGADAGSTFSACAQASRNRALRVALLRSRTLLESGTATAGNPDAPAITEALRATGYFPELALTIIGTGEASGGLIRALDSVARHYSTKAQERIAVFFAIFDKVVMLAVIAMVGAVALSMWLPIMTAEQNMHY
jgi:type II secretory pathway component PulF